VVFVVSVPDGVTASVTGKKVSMKGPKGSVERTFSVKGLSLKLDGKEISVGKSEGAKLSGAVLGSIESHIANMATGVTQGYEKKMTVLYAHFPISLEVKGSRLVIKNFIGEKKNREAEIVGSTKIAVKGADVTVSGPSKEDVGQTVANIRAAVKIRNRDPRVFQDGLYVVS
jgi:large subunit ribosomal protein L6